MLTGRRVNLLTGQRTLIVENTQVNDEAWTVYTNVLGEDVNSVFIEIELLGVGYGTGSDVTYTIAGRDQFSTLAIGTGDYYTGVGACRIFATCLTANNTISVGFVNEQKTMYVPPESYLFVGGGIGSFIDVGYPPFSRYFTAIYTNSNYNLQFRDEIGVAVYDQALTPADKVFQTKFFHPPNSRMRVVPSVAAQRFLISHYQCL